MGLHAQLVASWRKSPRLTLRIDGLATMLPGAGEDVLCAPSAAACRPTNVPHPDQVYAANASAELRRSGANDRLYGLIGAGAYYARGPSSTSFGTAAGVVAGVGASLTRPARAGLALELRYHYIPASFGTLTGMLTPSLVLRF